jgi:hypothetical protein
VIEGSCNDPEQPHGCTVQTTDGDAPFLAFEPCSGEVSSCNSSLFTLDLREGVTFDAAAGLATRINALLWGVSTTI